MLRHGQVVRQNLRKDLVVQSQYKDLLEKDMSEDDLAKPSREEEEKTAERTRAALGQIVTAKLSAAQPTHVNGTKQEEATFIRYTPGQEGSLLQLVCDSASLCCGARCLRTDTRQAMGSIRARSSASFACKRCQLTRLSRRATSTLIHRHCCSILIRASLPSLLFRRLSSCVLNRIIAQSSATRATQCMQTGTRKCLRVRRRRRCR